MIKAWHWCRCFGLTLIRSISGRGVIRACADCRSLLQEKVKLISTKKGATMSRQGSRIVAQGSILRQGLLFGRASSDSARPGVSIDCRAASTWERSSSSPSASEVQDKATRQMHSTADQNTGASTHTHSHLPKTTSIGRQQAVKNSRLAGGGITWAELFLMKRKRLLESP